MMQSVNSSNAERWKLALPTAEDPATDRSMITLCAECGYEKFTVAIPASVWAEIVSGKLIILRRLVPVGTEVIPCEWHFNRYKRGNLLVDWGKGDLRFWIGLEAVDIRHGETALAWKQEEGAEPSMAPSGARQLWARALRYLFTNA